MEQIQSGILLKRAERRAKKEFADGTNDSLQAALNKSLAGYRQVMKKEESDDESDDGWDQ